MKRISVLTITSVLMFFSILFSQVKAEKTGKIDKNVYTDSKFGFQIAALDNWKIKDQKEPSLVRVVMTQRNYKTSTIPGASKYTTEIPTILILADTTSLSLKEVEESLFKKGELLQNRDEFVIQLDLLFNSEYLEVNEVTVDSIPALDYILKQPYKKIGEDIREKDPINGSSVIIKDFVAGHIILFKKDQNIFVVQFSCEREFFYPVNSEFQKIIGSWKFIQ